MRAIINKSKYLFVSLLLASPLHASPLHANIEQEVLKESVYNSYYQILKEASWVKVLNMELCPKGLSCEEAGKQFVNAYLRLQSEGMELEEVVRSMDLSTLHVADRLRLELSHDKQSSVHNIEKYEQYISEPRVVSILCSYLGYCERYPTTVFPGEAVIRDVFENPAQVKEYHKGRYAQSPRLFMFCRQDRSYPCLLLMRDRYNKIVLGQDGKTPWHQPSLGYSRFKKPYFETDGHTPTGIFRIDGVMPKANKKMSYGEFRRLILYFVGAVKDESYHKLLLPASSHNSEWWQQAVVARDNGRSLFRIHGTKMRSFKWQNHYPLYPTRGCIMQREGRYSGDTFADQRLLLDTLMLQSGLEVKFENEPKIKGLLYIFNLDDQKRAVELKDLSFLW